jgi:hypothetical protein
VVDAAVADLDLAATMAVVADAVVAADEEKAAVDSG